MSTTPRRLGKYELQTRLGQGGMAEVWKAFDPQLKRYVAIKFMHAKLSGDPDFMVRFEREGQAIASLRHPNIVQVYDFQTSSPSETDDPLAYLVMDYIEGQTLADYIHSTSAVGNFPTPNQLVRLFTPICLAVDYAHQRGIIHRDIKPANILLDTRNTVYNSMGEPVLTDFGIVKVLGAATLTSTGMSLGTPLYISPEQVKGLPGDERSDIYSLGVMLFELCTGSPPFRGSSPYTIMMQHIQNPPPPARSLNPRIIPALEAFLFHCLVKEPEARFPSAAAMAAAFAQALNVPIPEQLRQFLPPGGQPTVYTQLPSAQRAPAANSAADIATLRAGATPLPVSDHGLSSANSAADMATLRAEATTPPSGSSVADFATLSSESASPSSISYSVPGSSSPSSGAPVVSGASSAPQPVLTPPRPSGRQRRGLVMILSTLVLLVLLGSGVGVFFLSHSRGNIGGVGTTGGTTSGSIVGHAAFTSSRELNSQGEPAMNDGLQVNLLNIPDPASGNRYYAWLQDNQTEPTSILLGTLNVDHGAASLSYSDGQHRDLLTTMSVFLVTEESASVPPNTPSIDKHQWRYYAMLPQRPSPKDNFSYLDHVRHLLSGEPALDSLHLHGGIDYWFLNNIQEMQKETIEVRDHVTLPFVRQQVANILYYLDGKCAPQELSNAPGPRTPENNTLAHDSQIGLLDCQLVPEPPGHVTHIGRHLAGIAQAPSAPADQVQRAIQINGSLSTIKALLEKVRADDLQLAAMNDTQLQSARSLRNDMAQQAESVVSGSIDPATQASIPSASQIASQIELLADFEVMPYKAQ